MCACRNVKKRIGHIEANLVLRGARQFDFHLEEQDMVQQRHAHKPANGP